MYTAVVFKGQFKREGYLKCVKAVCVCVCQECAERGEDYHRVKLLEISAEDAERWARKKKKRNPDPGFSGRNCWTDFVWLKVTVMLIMCCSFVFNLSF